MNKYFFVSLFCVCNLCALLPPLYESLHQIQSVINDPELANKFQPGELIISIERTDDGYLIKTNKSTLIAKVESVPQVTPGPGHYRVVFGETATK